MKLIRALTITACAGSLLALPIPVEALTTEQAEVGGMLAGIMCLEAKNLISQSDAKTAFRIAMQEEGYSLEMVEDKEVKDFAMKMFGIIFDDETCRMELY